MVQTEIVEYELETGCDNLTAETTEVQHSKDYDEALEENRVALSEMNDTD